MAVTLRRTNYPDKGGVVIGLNASLWVPLYYGQFFWF